MECPDGTGMFAEVKSDVLIESGSLDGFPDLNGTASVSGSIFSNGSGMLFACGGFVLGVIVTLLGVLAMKEKRKSNKAKNA